MSLIAAIGVGCNAIGLALAGSGLRQTWSTYGLEPFLAPVSVPLANGRARAVAAIKRALRRPQPRVVGAGAAVASIQTFQARARIGYGHLDKHDAIAAIARLEARTIELNSKLAELDERLADEKEATNALVGGLDTRLASEVTRLEALARGVAVEGVRLEALGLFFVAVGTVLQTLG